MIKSVQNTGNASNAVFYGDNDSSSTKNNRKNRININFESAKKTPAPMKGVELEHASDNVPANEEPDNIDDKDDKDDKNEQNEQYSQPSATEDNRFDNSTHSVNDTFTDLRTNEAKILARTTTRPSTLNSLSDAIDALEDIQDRPGTNINFLKRQFPSFGNLTGGTYFSSNKGKGDVTNTFQTYVENNWQNKKKNFAINASGALGVDWIKSSDNCFDMSDALEMSDDNSDTNSNFVENPQNDENKPSSTNSPGFSKNYTGNLTVRAKFDRKNWAYGAGISSNFYSDDKQSHYINFSALLKPLNIGADVTRSTVITRDDETGEKITNNSIKATVKILDNDPDNPEEFLDDYASEEATSLPEENIENTNNENPETPDKPSSPLSLFKSQKKRDGSGFDFDIEYDDSHFGGSVGYGKHFIYNPDKKVRLTLTPTAGIYDEKENNGEQEAWSFLAGAELEFKKRWRNNQYLDASLKAAFDRTIQSGSKPQDTSYIVFTGKYNNPNIQLSTTLDAGYVKTEAIKMGYIEANLNYNINENIALGAQAAYQRLNISGSAEDNYVVGAKLTYSIPYTNKK